MKTPSGHEVYGIGAEYPSAAALYEAAKSTVISNMIGKNAGTVIKFVGLPCTTSG